jgi:hypothetical protein
MPVTTGEWLGSVYAGWTGTVFWFLVGTDVDGYPIPPAGTAYALIVSALQYRKVTPEPDPEARRSISGGLFGPPLAAGVAPAVWDGTAWRLMGTYAPPAHAIRPFNGIIPFYTTKRLVPYFLTHGSLLWTLFPPYLKTRSGTKIVAIPILNHPSGPPFPSAEDVQDVIWLSVPTEWETAGDFILENPYAFNLIGDGGWNYNFAYGTAFVKGSLYFYLRADGRSFLSSGWGGHISFDSLPFLRQQLRHYEGVLTEDNWILCAGYCELGSQALTVNKMFSGSGCIYPYYVGPQPIPEQETRWLPVRALILGSFRPPNRLRIQTALIVPWVQWTDFLIEDVGCAVYEYTPTHPGSRLVYRTGFARPIRLGYVPSVSSPFTPLLRSLVATILAKPRFVIYHHGFNERILMAEVDPETNSAVYCTFRTVPHVGSDTALFAHEIIMQRRRRYEYRNGQPQGYLGTILDGFGDSRFFTEATSAFLHDPFIFPDEWWEDFLDIFVYSPGPWQFPTFVGHTLPQRYMMSADSVDSYFYQEIARVAAQALIGTLTWRNLEVVLDGPNLPYVVVGGAGNPFNLRRHFAGTFTLRGVTHLIEPYSVWYGVTHRLRVSGFSGRHSELFECSLRIETEMGPEFLRMLLPQPAFGQGMGNPSAFQFVVGIGALYFQDLPRPEWWWTAHPHSIADYFPQTFPNNRDILPSEAIRLVFGRLFYHELPPANRYSLPVISFPYGLIYSKNEIYRVITNADVGYMLEWRISQIWDFWDPFPSSYAVGIKLGASVAGGADVFWLCSTEDEFEPYRLKWKGGHAAPAPIAAFGSAVSFHPLIEFVGTCPLSLVFAPPFRELFARAGSVIVLNELAEWQPAAIFAGQAKDRSELSPMYWLVGAWRYRGSRFFEINFPPDGQVRFPVPVAVPVGSGYVVGTSFDGDWWQMPLKGIVYHPLYSRSFTGAANRLLFFHQGWQQTLPAGRQKRIPDPYEAVIRTGTYNSLDYEVTGVRQIITIGHAQVQLLPRHAIWVPMKRVPYFQQDGGRCPLWQGEPILAVDGFPLDDGRVHVWVYTVYGVYSLLVTPDGVEDWSFDPLPRFLRAFVGQE